MKIDISMFGDMAIKDLSPKDANSGGRIIKNLRICGSGLYEYHVSEAPLMGLSIPDDYHGDTFKILRPAEVLEANKELYARVPIITGHHVRVNTSNAKQLAVGMVGDTVQSEVAEDGELYLYTTGTIITGDGIQAYEQLGELSVGYDPIVEWMPGEYKGKAYQAVLKGFNEINHLLICKTARGGHQCMIMDSLEVFEKASKNIDGGKAMGIFKRIFAKPAETKTMTGDSKVISAMLQSIKAGADCKTQVKAVKDMLGDSADETLKGYFEDLMGDEVTKASKEELAKAIDVVDTYQQKLLGDETSEPVKPVKDEKKPENGDGCSAVEPPAGDKKDEPEQQSGDAKIDYDLLASKVAEKLAPAKKEETQQQTGDENIEENPMEASRMSMLLAGDSADTEVSSDSIMKEVWG